MDFEYANWHVTTLWYFGYVAWIDLIAISFRTRQKLFILVLDIVTPLAPPALAPSLSSSPQPQPRFKAGWAGLMEALI